MNQIESIITDVGNDVNTLNRINGVLFEQWQDVKAKQFDRQFLIPIAQECQLFLRQTSEQASALKKIEEQITDMAEELRKDAQNAQRLDIEI